MLGVTNDQNYNDIADALREVGADLSEETFTPSEMAPAIRGLRSRWGNIEGDIANQTDLQNALNSKADSADLGTMSEEDDAPSDDKQYGRKNGDWVPITDELANWGQIAGELSDQTDLQNALNSKADAADLGTMSEEDDAPSDNKQYGRKNGDWVPITDELANWGQIAGNLSDQTDLKGVLDEKLDAHESDIFGSIVTFEAENDHAIKGVTVNIDPVQDLHGYSNPWPAGGGKNLLGVTAVTTTANGLTFTVNADGTVKVNGTATAAGTFLLCGYRTLAAYGMVANQTYILSGTPSGLGDNCYLMFGVEGTASPEYRDKGSGAEFQPSDLTIEYRAIIVYTYGTTLSNVVFQPMIRKSTEDASWAPYTNICPISGHSTATVTRTGKNLLDAIHTPMLNGYISGSSKITGTSYDRTLYFPVKTNTTYTVSFTQIAKSTATTNDDFQLGLFSSEPTIDSVGYRLVNRQRTSPTVNYDFTYTFNSQSYTWVGVKICNVNKSDLSGTLATFQLELSSTATPYESYQGQQVTIDLDGTRYGGTLNVLTGELTLTHRYFYVDGTIGGDSDVNTMTEGSYSDSAFLCVVIAFKDQNLLSTNATILANGSRCNQFKWQFSNNNGTAHYYKSNNTAVFVSTSIASTIPQFQTYLASNPLQFVYPLKNPQTVQLTPEQISSVIGTNHLWADTGDSNVTLRLHTGDLAYQDTVDYETQVTNKPDFGSMLSGSETSMVATKNYASGSLIAVGDDLYKATSAIASGSNIVVGSNVTATTIEAELALKANSSSVYTKTQTDTLLNAKANASSVYTKTETDELLDEKLDKDSDTELSGDIVTFNAPVENAIKALSVSIDPVQDLHGYDAPWPAGGGKNLLKPPSSGATINGVTFTVNSDGTITANGTAGSGSNADFYIVGTGTSGYDYANIPSGNYIINGNDDIGSITGILYVVQEGGTIIAQVDYVNKNTNVTLSDTTKYRIFIRINAGKTVSNAVFKPMIRLASVTDATFAPYSNICPISGHDTATVTRTGKNLLDDSAFLTGAWNKYGVPNFLKPNTTYRFLVSGSTSYTYRLYMTSSSGAGGTDVGLNSNYQSSGNGQAFTTPADMSSYPYLKIGGSGSGAGLDMNAKFQITLGSTATAYEAPQIQQVTIDLDGTRYGGTLNVLTGEMVVTHKKHIVTESDGTNAWQTGMHNNGNRVGIIDNTLRKPTTSSEQLDVICNMAIASDKCTRNGSWSVGQCMMFNYNSNAIFFFIVPNEYTTASDARKYLADNGCEYVVPLAEPLTVQLTPSQMSTLLGTNNICADTGDVTLTLRTGAGRMAYQDVVDYDELTNKPDLNDKATVITETKSGSIVSISDGAEAPVSGLSVSIEPVQDLHGYDNPWPAGGGVNVMPPLVAGTYTADGITAVVDANGKITVTGTKTTSTSTNLYLSLSVDSYAIPNGYYVHIRNNQVYSNVALDMGGVSPTLNSINRILQNTSERTPSSSFKLFFASNLIDTTFNFTLQPSVEATSTVTDWTPYSNICPISGWTSAVVTRTGKNLLIKSSLTEPWDGVAGNNFTRTAINNYNQISLYGTDGLHFKTGTAGNAGGNGVGFKINFEQFGIKIGDVVTFSASIKGTVTGSIATGLKYYHSTPSSNTYYATSVNFYNIQNFSATEWQRVSGSFTVADTGQGSNKGYAYIIPSIGFNAELYIKDIQLEFGSVANPYEDNNKVVLTIDLDGTRYGGTVDVLTGEMTVTKAIVDLGTLTWSYATDNTYDVFYTPITQLPLEPLSKNTTTAKICISSSLKCLECMTFWNFANVDRGDATLTFVSGTQGTNRILVRYDTTTNISDFTTAMDGVQLVYDLLTPLTVQLTANQMQTLLGTNHIWADTGDVAVTYRADSKMYIDQKVDEAVRKTKQVIAAVTDTMVAPSNLTAGDFIIVGDDLIKATTNVASGATLTIGSNCVKTTVAEALIALASA